MELDTIKLDELPDWARQWHKRFEIVCTEAARTSDRACAIVMVAVIEELLRSLLEQYLPQTKVTLGKLVAPGNLRRLIDLSQGTGLIYQELATSLHQLADVRHHFAHQVLEDPRFEGPVANALVKKLTLPFQISGVPPTKSNRESFMDACGVCFLVLVLQHLNLTRLPIRGEELGKRQFVLGMEKAMGGDGRGH